MANRIERLDLDVGKENVIEETIIIQQGENISLTLEVNVFAYGMDFEVTENTKAYFLCARPDGTRIMADAEVVTRNPTFLTFDVPDAVCAADGTISLAYFLLTDAATGWKATTDYFQITVTTGILDAEPASDDGSVQELIAACEAMAEEFADSPNENRVEYLELDVNKENEVTELIVVQQGENISLTIEATVTESGRNLELSEGTNAYFLCAKPDGTNVIAKADVLVASPTAVVSVDVPSSVCAADGTIQLAYFMFSEPSSKWVMTTDAFQIVVTRGIDMDGIESTDDYQNLVAMLDELSVRLAGYDAEWAGLKTDSINATSAANTAAAGATSAAAEAMGAVSAANEAVQNANAAVEAADTAVANANAATGRANEAAESANAAASSADAVKKDAQQAASDAKAAASNANVKADAANTASNAANAAASAANIAAADATAAAEEARGAVSPEMVLYLTYDSIGGTDYLTLVDAEEA